MLHLAEVPSAWSQVLSQRKHAMFGMRKQPESARDITPKLPTDWGLRLPWIVLVILCLFIAASSYSTFKLALVSEQVGSKDSLYTIGPFIVFVGLAIAYSVWFITCFTGDVTGKDATDKKRQIFHFAYAFTITAFVILMIPVANPWQPDVIGPISLIRGCVLAPVGDEASVPGAVRCARAESAFLPKSVRQNFEPHQQSNAESETSELRCSKTTENNEACIVSASYPWLITLGGFNGLVVRDSQLSNVQPSTSGTQIQDTTAKVATKPGPVTLQTSIVQSGFVVPFYVVLLAFVGGAVSLARRIPEYQKRSGDGYEPTQKQPGLTALETREVVVFQIMQLVSAPFIAVVAFYAVSPSTMNSAIGLAFLSGFASELVLLQVRGVVEGLQPHVTAMTNPVNSKPSAAVSSTGTVDQEPLVVGGNSAATLKTTPIESVSGTSRVVGRVLNVDGSVAVGATVQIADGGGSAKTTEDGFFSLDKVPLGSQHLTVGIDDISTSIDISVSADTTDVGELRLGKQGAG
ncbi:MAG: hypothetical protein JWQ79_4165 [Mucilaginibacter sp.]|nr:hypothetical protein [Mucilaginibacter sp.]